MPYRTNGCPNLHNEGMKFLDNLLYEESSSAAWPVDKIVITLARSLLMINPQPYFILNRERKTALGMMIRHNIGSYIMQEFKGILARTDSIYQLYHDHLLYQLMERRNIAEDSLDSLAEEFIWGKQAYELKEIIDSPDRERYWQALLIDYALSQEQMNQHREVAGSAKKMEEPCLDFVLQTLFSQQAYAGLLEIKREGVLPLVFSRREQEHFSQLLENTNDSDIFNYEKVLSDFNCRKGLERMLRIKVMKKDYSSAENLAKKIISDPSKQIDLIKLLLNIYKEYDFHDKVCELGSLLEFYLSFQIDAPEHKPASCWHPASNPSV